VDPAPWGYRRDRDTWALAMRHLERFRPRVLYVGLGDADEWAHLADYGAYVASVRDLDARLEELFARLATMGDYGAGASVLVTTDHGRGDDDWTAHGNAHPGSRHAWLFASTPATRRAHGRSSRGAHDHLAIRPTIEALLGLEPCTGCQAPLTELLTGPTVARARDAAPGAGGP
jgi:arylsulfatase A-like enzyme